MNEETKIVTTKTITLDEKDIERIIRESIKEKFESELHRTNIFLYQDTVYAHQVMGAIDDVTSIKCKIVIVDEKIS